jgi:hypothetical protein
MDNVRRELEPGLGISRLSRDDYLRFLRLGAFFTAYVRGKQVSAKANTPRVMHSTWFQFDSEHTAARRSTSMPDLSS